MKGMEIWGNLHFIHFMRLGAELSVGGATVKYMRGVENEVHDVIGEPSIQHDIPSRCLKEATSERQRLPIVLCLVLNLEY